MFENNSVFSLDYFFQHDQSWLSQIKINDYPVLVLVWNLFLILIPFFLFFVLQKYIRKTKLKHHLQKIKAVVLFLFWLLFYPNAVYLITEIRHVSNFCFASSPHHVCLASAWMIIFLFCYALLGWLAFVFLTKQMFNLISKLKNRYYGQLFLLLIIPLNALALLLGLLSRWNSWEIFTTPILFFKTIILYFTNSAYFLNWLIFSLFLYILYWIGDIVLVDFKKIKQKIKKQKQKIKNKE